MANQTARALLRLYIVFVYLYALSPFGATFNGIINPDSQRLTFGIMLVSLLIWCCARRIGSWSWHQSALDIALPLWALALLASFAANPSTSHRSLIGLWYVFLYAGAFIVLCDSLSNRPSIAKTLVDGLLSAGLILLFFSLLQMWMTGQWMQPVSVIGNPNALGTVLIVLLAFVLGRASAAKTSIRRTGYVIYALLIIANLLATLSRGAWLGMIAAIVSFIILLLLHLGILSWTSLRERWHALPAAKRKLLLGGALVAAITFTLLIALIANSFAIHERRAQLRLEIWQSALQQFREKPLTGQGLFTFGFHHARIVSSPPSLPYSHAHSLPLNIAAELGMLGLAALAVTVRRLYQSCRFAWSNPPLDDRILLISAISALVGFALHHLVDTTAMMPAVVLVGMHALIIVVAPARQAAVKPGRRSQLYTVGIISLWIIVLASGWKSSETNRAYVQALRVSGVAADWPSSQESDPDYRAVNALISAAIEQNPNMPVYYQQRALLWGLLAADGDRSALEQAIADLVHFLDMEPHHAPSWRNLAALYLQAGDKENAELSLERNRALAPESDLFAGVGMADDAGSARPISDWPYSGYNQEFTRFNFLRESLPLTYLPQVAPSVQK